MLARFLCADSDLMSLNTRRRGRLLSQILSPAPFSFQIPAGTRAGVREQRVNASLLERLVQQKFHSPVFSRNHKIRLHMHRAELRALRYLKRERKKVAGVC